ncbi:hypothetical protein ILYODFUR_038437 [Ilyodon furcidens]|uniref:Uncharacterized protein n=1 Tax=Ilyodon furcidens TaxID=33524 RepID=A0ABV0TRJ2_9TELE
MSGKVQVIGQDGVVIFVRRGETYVRVHQSRLRKVNEPQEKEEGTEKENTIKQMKNYSRPSSDRKTMILKMRKWYQQVMNQLVLQKTVNPHVIHVILEGGDLPPADSAAGSEGLIMKAGQVVKYTDRETGQKYTGKLTSRAGKVTGKQKLV